MTPLDSPLLGIPPAVAANLKKSPLRQYRLPPVRIVWTSGGNIRNAERLLQSNSHQSLLDDPKLPCVLPVKTGLMLDFGCELHGHIELFTPRSQNQAPCPVRIRFGESVSEAMAELSGDKRAQNDHALRDQTLLLPWLGKGMAGPSGFRFVRIDALERDVELSEVSAILVLRDLPVPGAFRCNDERLNRIWSVGAYTVHLNMQDYLWDGIKRDRLVWIGDMHPEVSTIHSVFGFNEVVSQSLDLTRDAYPPESWMNGISSYSMWWVLIQHELWMHHGDRRYLEAQRTYLMALLKKLATCLDTEGRETLDGMRFLDWPTAENKDAVHEGLQALMLLTMEAGRTLCLALNEDESTRLCSETMHRLKGHIPGPGASKQSTALMMLAGLMEEMPGAALLKQNGPAGLSTFFGYYVLEALARAGEIDTALDFISRYWGGMLDFGATTFWEDFDLAWTENAGRIDELVPEGKRDLHGDFGAHCYKGLRHSLCHGWASGPTSWLSRHVLGIRPLAPGFAKVEIKPQLGTLTWAEGTYPTPRGIITVRHERRVDGTVKSSIKVPKNVETAGPDVS